MPEKPSDSRSVWITTALVVVAAFLLFADWPGRWDDVGLWEPNEIAVADEARSLVPPASAAPGTAVPAMATATAATTAAPAEKRVTRLGPAVIAWGFETWGVSERAGRRVVKILAALALIACYLGMLALMGPRAAVITTVIAAGAPLLFLQARSLLGDMPFTLGVGLTFVSLCVYLEGRVPWSRAVAAVAFVIGLYLCWRSRSYTGVAIPLVGGLMSLGVSWRIADPAEHRLFRRLHFGALLGFLGGLAWVAAGVWQRMPALLGEDAPASMAARVALGASPGNVPEEIGFQWVFEQIGLGFAPWTAFLPVVLAVAVGVLISGPAEGESAGDAGGEGAGEGAVQNSERSEVDLVGRLALAGLLWTITIAFVLGTLGRLVNVPYAPAVIPLAVACGATFEYLMRGRRIPGLFAFLGALFAFLLARDMAGYPDAVARLLVPFGTPKIPDELGNSIALPVGFMMTGALFAAVIATLVMDAAAVQKWLRWRDRLEAWRQRSKEKDAAGQGLLDRMARWEPAPFVPALARGVTRVLVVKLVAGLLRLFVRLGRLVRPAVAVAGMVAARARRNAVWVLPVASLAFGGYTALRFMPALSAHLSQKGVFDTYNLLAVEGEPIAEFGVRGGGAVYYLGDKLLKLSGQRDFLDYMRAPERKFALISATAFAGLHVAAGKESVSLFVLDDSNANQLLVSNLLRDGEVDRNVVTRYVSKTPPVAGSYTPVNADFEGKLTLLGYHLDKSVVSRGEEFTIKLFFEVKAPLGRAYKIFYHVDGRGGRIKGDHEPVKGKFPSNYWQPGDYIIDEHTFSVGVTQGSGPYTAWFGLYTDGRNDDSRLKIRSAGAAKDDGYNRLGVTTITVR